MSVFKTERGAWVEVVLRKQKHSFPEARSRLMFPTPWPDRSNDHPASQGSLGKIIVNFSSCYSGGECERKGGWKQVLSYQEKKSISHTLLSKRRLGNLDRQEAVAAALAEKAGTSPSHFHVMCSLKFSIGLSCSQTCDCTGTTHLPTDTGLAA